MKKSEEAVTGVTEAPTHPLFKRPILPIKNWAEFLTRWQEAKTWEEMLGLLHAGFNIVHFYRRSTDQQEFKPADRLIFYLTIADGWTHPESLCAPDEDRYEKQSVGLNETDGRQILMATSELRQALMKKAFDQLCQHFFGKGKSKDGEPLVRDERYWTDKVLTPEIFPRLMSFFRVKESRSNVIEIRNLPCPSSWRKVSHHEKQVISFLLDLASFLWRWKETEIEGWWKEEDKATVAKFNREMRARVNQAMPWMIEVLVSLGRLDILAKRDIKLNSACLVKLKEIALLAELSPDDCLVRERRRVGNLEEASLAGSAAADFLLKYQLNTKTRAKLEMVYRAQEKSIEARDRLKALTARQLRRRSRLGK